LNFADADLLVDARAFLRGGLRGSDWTTNGLALLCCCNEPAWAGWQYISTNPAQVNG